MSPPLPTRTSPGGLGVPVRRRGAPAPAEEAVVSRLVAAGLREVILPVLDYADPYRGVTAEGDERLYRFIDREGETLSLRADFTPMAARVVAPRLGRPRFRCRSSTGATSSATSDRRRRAREFAQIGAERYGDPRPRATRRCSRWRSPASPTPDRTPPRDARPRHLLPRLLAFVARRSPARRRRRRAEPSRDGRVAAAREAGAGPDAVREIGRSLLSGFDPRRPLRSAVPGGRRNGVASGGCGARTARPGISVVVDSPDAHDAVLHGSHVRGRRGRSAARSRRGPVRPAPGTVRTVRAGLGFCIGSRRSRPRSRPGQPGRAAALRVAVGKGRLLSRSLAILRASGLDVSDPDGRRLVVPDRAGGSSSCS